MQKDKCESKTLRLPSQSVNLGSRRIMLLSTCIVNRLTKAAQTASLNPRMPTKTMQVVILITSNLQNNLKLQ